MYIAKNIKYLRKRADWTQQKLADKAEVTVSRIGSYEEGRSEPPAEMLVKFSELFHVSVDALIKCDLSTVDPEAMMKVGENRILFPIMVDRDNNDLVEVVTAKASAGYLQGMANPQFFKSLPMMSLPFRVVGKHRTFPIKGDSMPPLATGDFVIGKFVESLKDIKDGNKYVIVTKDEGITYKRTYWKGSLLELRADNKMYQPYTVKPGEILEAWEFVCALNLSDYKPEELNMDSIIRMLQGMRVEIEKVDKK